MAIKPASELRWTPPPRCPVCGVGVLASGQSEPFVEDADGSIYCREHGGDIDPDYAARLSEYRAWRERRAKALAALEADARPKTGSDAAE